MVSTRCCETRPGALAHTLHLHTRCQAHTNWSCHRCTYKTHAGSGRCGPIMCRWWFCFFFRGARFPWTGTRTVHLQCLSSHKHTLLLLHLLYLQENAGMPHPPSLCKCSALSDNGSKLILSFLFFFSSFLFIDIQGQTFRMRHLVHHLCSIRLMFAACPKCKMFFFPYIIYIFQTTHNTTNLNMGCLL